MNKKTLLKDLLIPYLVICLIIFASFGFNTDAGIPIALIIFSLPIALGYFTSLHISTKAYVLTAVLLPLAFLYGLGLMVDVDSWVWAFILIPEAAAVFSVFILARLVRVFRLSKKTKTKSAPQRWLP